MKTSEIHRTSDVRLVIGSPSNKQYPSFLANHKNFFPVYINGSEIRRPVVVLVINCSRRGKFFLLNICIVIFIEYINDDDFLMKHK